MLDIPALGDKIAEGPWQEVQELKEKDRVSETSIPISIVGLIEYMEMDKLSLTKNKWKGEEDGGSEANTLSTLLSFLGDYEKKIKVIPFPKLQQITPSVKDTADLQAILSAPVRATLPLAGLLKVKPKLWEYVAETMGNKGLCLIKEMIRHEQNKDKIESVKYVPFNKMSSYQVRN